VRADAERGLRRLVRPLGLDAHAAAVPPTAVLAHAAAAALFTPTADVLVLADPVSTARDALRALAAVRANAAAAARDAPRRHLPVRT
jgi:hypothetical protein